MFWILKDINGFSIGAGEGPTGADIYSSEEAWAKEVDVQHKKSQKKEDRNTSEKNEIR